MKLAARSESSNSTPSGALVPARDRTDPAKPYRLGVTPPLTLTLMRHTACEARPDQSTRPRLGWPVECTDSQRGAA